MFLLWWWLVLGIKLMWELEQLCLNGSEIIQSSPTNSRFQNCIHSINRLAPLKFTSSKPGKLQHPSTSHLAIPSAPCPSMSRSAPPSLRKLTRCTILPSKACRVAWWEPRQHPKHGNHDLYRSKCSSNLDGWRLVNNKTSEMFGDVGWFLFHRQPKNACNAILRWKEGNTSYM